MSRPASRGDAAIAMQFEEFFRVEYPRLVPMLEAVVGDRGRAEDLAQESLATAQREWPKVGSYERPGAWVRRVALHRAANVRRRRGREVIALRRVGAARDVADTTDLVDDALWRLVRTLPRQQRHAVALHYVDDRPVAEIAEILQCSEGTVKTHLSRARATLARQLPDHRNEATS